MDDSLIPIADAPISAELAIEAPDPHETRATLWRARLMVFVAATMWSLSGLFVKAPALEGWSGPVLAFWRAAFACLVLWPLVRKPSWNWKLLPMTVLFAGMNYSFLTAMAKGSTGNAIWLQCTAPVWVLLIGVFVFRERAIWRDWLLVALVMMGVGIILYYESSGAALEAVAWGLISGMFYAGVVLSLRQLRDMDAIWVTALNLLVTAIVLAPFAFSSPQFPSGMQWLLLAALGVFQIGLPYILFGRALKHIPGHEATGIGMIEPILNPLWVYLAWGEPTKWWTIVGGGFILVGLAVRYFEPKRKSV